MKYLLTILFTFQLILAMGQARTGTVLIKGGTVLTVANGTLDNTDVLIVDGKISKIGKQLKASANTKVIDAAGLYVMPGIIDAHSHIALTHINEWTAPVTAEVQMRDALNPFDIAIYRALAGGVTVIQALHGSANVIGGQCETLKLRYGTLDPDSLVMIGAPRTIKFALGENPTRVHGTNSILPGTRMGVEFVIRKAFAEALVYKRDWDLYKKLSVKKDFRGAPPAYSYRMETLADILNGKISIQCHSYRADEIQMMLRVCKDFGIKNLVLQHANEGFKVAPEIAAAGAMASVFADYWAYKFEVYYSTAYNAAILTRNGVVTSINSDSDDLIRYLFHEAAKSQKYGGLSDDEALALITLNPAKQLGIDKRVGSLAVGKDGDVAIFTHHPLSIYAIPVYTLVDGVVRFDRAHDADDQRISVDPDEPLDVPIVEITNDHSRCLEGYEENFNLLFGSN